MIQKVIDELIEFVKDRDAKFLNDTVSLDENQVRILGRTVKLGEEVGELNNDILNYLGLQRKSKLERFDFKHLEDEFVDVLITLLVLASRIPNIDLTTAIRRKIREIRARS